MPIYGPWTWSQPHNRHYSYLLADDGVTVLDTIWAGPTGPAIDPVATGPSSARHVHRYDKTNFAESISRTSRNGGDTSLNTSQRQPYTAFNSFQSNNMATSPLGITHASQSHVPQSPSRFTHKATGSGHDTTWGNSGKYQQRSVSYGSGGDDRARNDAIAGSNHTTEPYELSPEHTGIRRPVASLPIDVQSSIHSLERRYIQTNPNENSNHEQLDVRK
jgi:hypothetical protein